MYGVDMSIMAPTVLREPLVDVVPNKAVISSSSKVLDLDLCTMNPSEVNFVAGYQVKINKDERCHGLIGWWDANFGNLPNP